MPATLAQWRQRQTQEHKARVQQRHYDGTKREWVSIDGEGWGRDEAGRQYYRFMIAANERGFQSKCVPEDSTRHALTMDEALTWLASLPSQYRMWCDKTERTYYQPWVGGFALGYDYAHILIDITQVQLEQLLTSSDFESPPTKLTDQHSAKLTSGNLRIYSADRQQMHGELVSIWDTFKYYQAAFLKVMKAYATPEQWSIIEEGKNRRNADADHSMQDEIIYCLNECRVHSRAMNDLQRAVHEMDLHPRGWYGPGTLSGSAFKKHNTKAFWKADDEQEPGLQIAARYAYVGGRFETTGHGWLPEMYGHDIRSAYPKGMTQLPCLAHGTWHHVTGSEALQAMHADVLSVGLVEWHCADPAGGWGPYPTRSVESDSLGTLARLPAWPFNGRNWLWNEEFRAGLFLTSSVDCVSAWVYQKSCMCEPFGWIPEYYDLKYRLAEEGNDIGSKTVKLILNSGYGKIAQSVGKPPVPTWIWAGLITASAHAQLLSALSQNPSSCIMVATDAVYSTEPLNLDFGKALGQWDGPDEHGRTLVIQAGFWRDYDSGDSKTRGIAKRYCEPMWPVFEDVWNHICAGSTDIHTAVVPIRYSDHIGLQRARQYGVSKLGVWTDDAYQNVRFRVDKRPHLIGAASPNGWWRSAPTRNDLVGVQLSLGVTVGEQYLGSSSSEDAFDKWFIIEQPDAAEWGYED